MRRAKIFFKKQLAGILSETDTGYRFEYLSEYLSLEDAKPVSLTLPLTDIPYESNVLFPAFDGLIPEGWLLDVALRNTDISSVPAKRVSGGLLGIGKRALIPFAN